MAPEGKKESDGSLVIMGWAAAVVVVMTAAVDDANAEQKWVLEVEMLSDGTS